MASSITADAKFYDTFFEFRPKRLGIGLALGMAPEHPPQLMTSIDFERDLRFMAARKFSILTYLRSETIDFWRQVPPYSFAS